MQKTSHQCCPQILPWPSLFPKPLRSWAPARISHHKSPCHGPSAHSLPLQVHLPPASCPGMLVSSYREAGPSERALGPGMGSVGRQEGAGRAVPGGEENLQDHRGRGRIEWSCLQHPAAWGDTENPLVCSLLLHGCGEKKGPRGEPAALWVSKDTPCAHGGRASWESPRARGGTL